MVEWSNDLAPLTGSGGRYQISDLKLAIKIKWINKIFCSIYYILAQYTAIWSMIIKATKNFSYV